SLAPHVLNRYPLDGTFYKWSLMDCKILIRNKTTCSVILGNCKINIPENIRRKYYGFCFSHLTMGTPIVLLTGHCWQETAFYGRKRD
ncbi:hypothetical protein KKI24_29285, partial [bacterium]|nr:hypothetical protein [bacterium]